MPFQRINIVWLYRAGCTREREKGEVYANGVPSVSRASYRPTEYSPLTVTTTLVVAN